jgi:hypothetical protein
MKTVNILIVKESRDRKKLTEKKRRDKKTYETLGKNTDDRHRLNDSQ